MKKSFYLLVVMTFLAIGVFATDRNKDDMKAAALRVLKSNARRANSHDVQANELKEYVSKEKLSVFGYQDGFAVIAKDDRFCEVLGYSQTAYQDTMPCGFRWWIDQIDAAMKQAKAPVEHFLPRQLNATVKESVQPLLTTKWGQQKPFYNNCVYTLNGKSYQFVTGCVATAMAQIMKFYRYPEKGRGCHSYLIKFSQGKIAISADFSESTYDWDNMLDDYSSYSYSSLQDKYTEAVAKLMSDCGISVNMQYNGNASSASQADVPAALRNYFGYDDFATHYFRKNRTTSQWMGMIYDELSHNRPIIYGGISSQGGHTFVLHGYNEEGLVYVNWGWYGSYDGYYNIELLNPDKYTFKNEQEMVVFSPIPKENINSKVITLNDGERLYLKIPNEDKYNIDELKVIGEINGEDILYLRNMVGYAKESDTYMDGKLTKIDLSEAKIIASEDVYFTRNSNKYKTENNVLPQYLFFESYSNGRLSSIILPDSITRIGRNAFFPCANLTNIVIPSKVTKIDMQAFQYCRNLKTIVVENPTPPEITSNTFADVDKNECVLYVPIGSKSLYKNARYWNDFNNILEPDADAVIVTAKSYTRKYGEANPTFEYEVSGAALEGTPEITCEATVTSPVGSYPIIIKKGCVTNYNDTYINGILTITKAPLIVKVEDATREQYQENPEFVITYSSWKVGDDESVLTKKPTATTTATKDSPVGEYEIVVSGGEAQNYELAYESGILTVTEPTGIVTFSVIHPIDIYTLQGHKVRTKATTLDGLPKGVYIVNTRKVVVK